MNSLVGKSTGIALLMAAALLAALFAMGVFAPGGANADVRGGVAKPDIQLSDLRLGKEVTLTITFQVDQAISSTERNVTVVLPVDLDIANDFDNEAAGGYANISLKQGTKNVGSIVYTNGTGTLVLSVPATDSTNGIVEANTPTTLVVSKLMTPATAPGDTQTLTIIQVDQSASESVGTSKTFVFGASVTSASAMLGTGNANESDVLTLRFRGDSQSTNTNADTDGVQLDEVVNAVAIVLPVEYDLDIDGPYEIVGCDDRLTTCNDGNDTANPDTGGTIAVSGDTNVGVVTPIVDGGADGDSFTVHTFGSATSNPEIRVVISGLTNPNVTDKFDIGFRQAGEAAQKTASVYVTKASDVELRDPAGDRGVEISSIDAGDEDVSLSFNFKPVISGGAEPPIVIELNDGFVMGTDSVVTLTQMVDGIPVDVYGEVTYDEDDRNAISITLGETTDTADTPAAERRRAVDKDLGNIYVSITGLTNPNTIGRDINLVTVTQGNYAPASHSVRMTGTELSTTVAGDPVRIKISTQAPREIPAGDDIVVTLKNFILPATIAENQVIIDGGDVTAGDGVPDKDERYYGIPSAVSVSGDKVTLSIPASYPDGSQVVNGIPSGKIYTITFKLGAGIKNPTVKLADRTPTASGESTAADSTEVTSKVSAKNAVTPSRKANASRGDLVDFSVVGLRTGSATLYLMKGYCVDARQDSDGCVDHTGAEVLDTDGDPRPANEDDDFRIGGDLQTDGRVTVQRRVTSSLFAANEGGNGPRELVGTTLVGTNIIYSVDGTGTPSDAIGRLAIEPTVDLGTQSLKQGGLLELDISDWHYGTITGIHVGGVPVVHSWRGGGPVTWTPEGVSGGEADFIVVMPPGVRLGEQQLKLTGTTTDEQDPRGAGNEDSFATKIVVDPLDLEITPVNSDGIPEVVINQEFTIEGRGFNTESGACIQSVKFGDVTFDETTAGVDVDCSSDGLRPDTAGNFSATFRLDPDLARVRTLKIGEYRVEVKDNEERVGVVDVLIPEPVVEVTPASSRRGTTVTVVGSKFPASSELAVEIKYGLAGNERTITAATPDSVGNWRETFVIPTTAVIGEDHVVKAAPIDTDYDHFEGKGTHRLPEQEVIVTPSRVAAGGRLTVQGRNMPLFTLVHLKISNITVSGDGFETDGVGDFTKTNVLVPQLQPGIHTVEALVETQGDRAVSVRTSVEVADIVTRPSAEAFEELISAASLTRVWHLDAATQTWSFFDPAPEFADFNTLTEVSSEQIVTIIMSAQDDFQGRALYVGSNNVAIE